ncbi:MAG: hypothetical protein ABJ263_00045 [Tateyamaria sp.]
MSTFIFWPRIKVGVTGKTKLFAIIGDPVEGVVSPPSINAWFNANGIDACMMPLNIPATNIASFWDLQRASNSFLGCSITYPHKQSAFAQVDTLTARATRLGALNTVRREDDGSLCGDATDGTALLQAIAGAEVGVYGASVQIKGAGGGAGRAIVDALCQAGAAQVILEDADETRLAQTVSLVERFWPNTSIGDGGPADILIDATPNGKNANAAPLFSLHVVSSCKAVCDIAGQHGESQFLKTAEQMKKIAIDAEDMGRCQVEAQMAFLFRD